MFSDINFLKTLLDTIEEGVLVYNDQGLIIGYNRQVLETFELSADEILGKTSVHPRFEHIKLSGERLTYDEFPSTITRTTGKVQKDIVLGLKMKPDYIKWVNVNTKIFKYKEADFVFATFLDVTEKHKLNEEISLTKDRLKNALQGNDFGFWDYDADKGEVFFSDEWKRILGFDPMNNMTAFSEWEQLIHHDDKEVVLKTLSEYMNGRLAEFDMEYRLLLKDGSNKWVRSIGKAVGQTKEGRLKRFSGTIEDISESKRTAELLRSKEDQFAKAFHYSKIGMALTDPDGRWIDANAALCDILGYKKEELTVLNYQKLTHPDDLAEDEENVRKVLHKEIPSYTMEKRFYHKNGSVVWALLTVSMVWNTDDTPKFFIAQVIDITQTKTLISQLETKNSQLKITTLDLENKIEQLEEFNRIVAHNLRGPVGNIIQLADMLSEDTSEADFYVSLLKEASKSLDGTLRELIKILEIKLNHGIELQKCSFNTMIEKVKGMLNIQIQKSDIVFNTHLSVDEIEYPPIYLESILYNLINNAIKYRRTNVNSEVVVSTYLQKGKVVLEVADNGLGIDLDKYGHQVFKLNKIFHKGYDSKGLGLFIVKNQIETLGGNISVESVPDKGSIFKVVF